MGLWSDNNGMGFDEDGVGCFAVVIVLAFWFVLLFACCCLIVSRLYCEKLCIARPFLVHAPPVQNLR